MSMLGLRIVITIRHRISFTSSRRLSIRRIPRHFPKACSPEHGFCDLDSCWFSALPAVIHDLDRFDLVRAQASLEASCKHKKTGVPENFTSPFLQVGPKVILSNLALVIEIIPLLHFQAVSNQLPLHLYSYLDTSTSFPFLFNQSTIHSPASFPLNQAASIPPPTGEEGSC